MNFFKFTLNYINFLKKQTAYNFFSFLILSILAGWSFFRVSYQVLQNKLPSQTTSIERFCCTPSPIVFSNQTYIDNRAFNIFFSNGNSKVYTKGELVEKISHFYFGIFFRHYFQFLMSSTQIKAEAGLNFFFCDPKVKTRFGFAEDVEKVSLITYLKDKSESKVEQLEIAEVICQ